MQNRPFARRIHTSTPSVASEAAALPLPVRAPARAISTVTRAKRPPSTPAPGYVSPSVPVAITLRDATGRVMEGHTLADAMLDDVALHSARFRADHARAPKLAVVLVGRRADSQKYVRVKRRTALCVGIDTDVLELPSQISMDALLQRITALNADDTVDGIIIQLPLPAHLDATLALQTVDPIKDVDGFHYANQASLLDADHFNKQPAFGFRPHAPGAPFTAPAGESATAPVSAAAAVAAAESAAVAAGYAQAPHPPTGAPGPAPATVPAARPALTPSSFSRAREPAPLASTLFPSTPLACLALLDAYAIPLRGAHVVVLGRSAVVGFPLSLMLMHRGAAVSSADANADAQTVRELCQSADVVVTAVGKPGFVTQDLLKPGAVVIDVGINFVDQDDLPVMHHLSPLYPEVAAAPATTGDTKTSASTTDTTVDIAAAHVCEDGDRVVAGRCSPAFLDFMSLSKPISGSSASSATVTMSSMTHGPTTNTAGSATTFTECPVLSAAATTRTALAALVSRGLDCQSSSSSSFASAAHAGPGPRSATTAPPTTASLTASSSSLFFGAHHGANKSNSFNNSADAPAHPLSTAAADHGEHVTAGTGTGQGEVPNVTLMTYCIPVRRYDCVDRPDPPAVSAAAAAATAAAASAAAAAAATAAGPLFGASGASAGAGAAAAAEQGPRHLSGSAAGSLAMRSSHLSPLPPPPPRGALADPSDWDHKPYDMRHSSNTGNPSVGTHGAHAAEASVSSTSEAGAAAAEALDGFAQEPAPPRPGMLSPADAAALADLESGSPPRSVTTTAAAHGAFTLSTSTSPSSSPFAVKTESVTTSGDIAAVVDTTAGVSDASVRLGSAGSSGAMLSRPSASLLLPDPFLFPDLGATFTSFSSVFTSWTSPDLFSAPAHAAARVAHGPRGAASGDGLPERPHPHAALPGSGVVTSDFTSTGASHVVGAAPLVTVMAQTTTTATAIVDSHSADHAASAALAAASATAGSAAAASVSLALAGRAARPRGTAHVAALSDNSADESAPGRRAVKLSVMAASRVTVFGASAEHAGQPFPLSVGPAAANAGAVLVGAPGHASRARGAGVDQSTDGAASSDAVGASVLSIQPDDGMFSAATHTTNSSGSAVTVDSESFPFAMHSAGNATAAMNTAVMDESSSSALKQVPTSLSLPAFATSPAVAPLPERRPPTAHAHAHAPTSVAAAVAPVAVDVIGAGKRRGSGHAGANGGSGDSKPPGAAAGKPGARRVVMVGDADFASVLTVAKLATPVPGGVGPVTVATLLRNTVTAAHLVAKRAKGQGFFSFFTSWYK